MSGARLGPDLPLRSLALLVALLALATYANALGNGWAFDDELVITGNPVVTEGRWADAFAGPYRSGPDGPPALYRPTTTVALALQWAAFGNRPWAFHAVSVALHMGVCVLVTLLLARLVPPLAAAAGGAVFAVHPVHVEAVANGVGQAELLAALAYLGACLLYLDRREGGSLVRAVRLLGIVALYAVGLGAKEIAVTLPAALLLLELAVPRSAPVGSDPAGPRAAVRRTVRAAATEAPLLIALTGVLAAFLAARVWIVGSVRGDQIAPELLGLTAGERVLTAFSTWPTIARLLVAPFALSADYGPALLTPARAWRPDVAFGAALLASVLAAALGLWTRAPRGAFAAAWLALTLVPVSNLIVPAGVLLAERTLYLPSVAVAVAAAAGMAAWGARPPLRRYAWVGAAAVIGVFMARSAARNPVWMSSFTVMEALAREHPDSWRAHRSRAQGLVRAGDLNGARDAFESALALMPRHYGLLCEAGVVHARLGQWDRAGQRLRAAVDVDPSRPVAYRLLAETHLLAGEGRAAHAAALAGLAQWGTDRTLWSLVSESYVTRGDLGAAIRAREAALAADPSSARDRDRLAELVAARALGAGGADAGAR